MKPLSRAGLCCLFWLLFSCASSSPLKDISTLPAGDHELSFDYGGRKRYVLVHVPPGAQKPMPVVINFHGGGGNPWQHKKWSLMDKASDKHGFVALYPAGTGLLPRKLLTWNAGRCCAYARKNNIDDVGFILAFLQDLSTRLPLDPTRVYATGLSNGGMMAYRLAVDASDHIAAIAPIAAALVTTHFNPKRPVPIFHIHSLDDPRVPFSGSTNDPESEFHFPSIETTLAPWLRLNGCAKTPKLEKRVAKKTEEDQEQQAEKFVYSCQKADVVLWRLKGAGHTWPGGEGKKLEWLLGPATGVINADEEMWAFFAQHPYPQARF